MVWTVRPDGAVDFIISAHFRIRAYLWRRNLQSRLAQFTRKTFHVSWKSGKRTCPLGNLMRMRCAYAGLTGSIAGSWFSPCHCATIWETSLSGLERVLKSRVATRPEVPCD